MAEKAQESSIRNYDDISGYLHSVSPVKLSRSNHRYFNAVLQTDRDEYHDTVVFASEKHNEMVIVAKNKTPVKLTNTQKSVGHRQTDCFDVKCFRNTRVEVTELNFPNKAPKELTRVKISAIQSLRERQPVHALQATVCKIAKSTKTLSEAEMKACWVQDDTGTMKLALWESQMCMVEEGKTYVFTNLSTRMFKEKLTLTCTHGTTFEIVTESKQLPVPKDLDLSDEEVECIKSAINGAQITVKKYCPKCRTAQEILSKRPVFHKCIGCKVRRKSESYVTKCHGILEIEGRAESFTVSNSVLQLFLKNKSVNGYMDAQDIEEILLKNGPVDISFTSEYQIISITDVTRVVEGSSFRKNTQELQDPSFCEEMEEFQGPTFGEGTAEAVGVESWEDDAIDETEFQNEDEEAEKATA